jgi:hypothetical protein
MTPKVSLGAKTCFDVEVLLKDVTVWLEDPDGTSGWGPAFTSLEQWERWWEGTGPRLRDESLKGFEGIASARVAAGIKPDEGLTDD